jgi:putative redox protein
MKSRAVARRRSGYTHDVEIEGRHELLLDEPTDAGGADEGPSPTRTVAGALAACVAITVEMYADRKGWDLDEVEVEVEMEYEGYVPRSMEVSLKLPHGLSEEQIQRLKVIAAKCPVHRMLTDGVEVSDRVAPG